MFHRNPNPETERHWKTSTHYVQEVGFRFLKTFDMVHYCAGNNHQKMDTEWSGRDGLDQLQ